MRNRTIIVVFAAVAALLAGCSADKVVTTGTAAGNTAVTTPDTTPADTTPAVTEAPTTSTIPGPQGWVATDLSGEPGPLAYPCCGSNWYGPASPPLPTDLADIADGSYIVRLSWADDPTQPLVGTLHRLDQCSALPKGSCEPADSYADDEMGIDPNSSLDIEIPLDGTLRVALLGFAGLDETAAAVGNGADLAQLAAALDDDYRQALLAPLAAGVAPDDIVMGLWASGDFHFGKPNYDWEPAPSEVVYTNFGAPPLLFQAAFGFDDTPADNRGVDILGLPGISVKDGQITLYVYAGWYS